jgi:hypothetical protein
MSGQVTIKYGGVALPIDHGQGGCRLCGFEDTVPRYTPLDRRWVIRPTPAEGRRGICSACYERVVELLRLPKVEMLAFRKVLAAESNPNVLALARHNATGDWRRSWISRRLLTVRRYIARAGWLTSAERVPGTGPGAVPGGNPKSEIRNPQSAPDRPYGEVADISGGRAWIETWDEPINPAHQAAAAVIEQSTGERLYVVGARTRQAAYRKARAWLRRQMRPAAGSRVHESTSSRVHGPAGRSF